MTVERSDSNCIQRQEMYENRVTTVRLLTWTEERAHLTKPILMLPDKGWEIHSVSDMLTSQDEHRD